MQSSPERARGGPRKTFGAAQSYLSARPENVQGSQSALSVGDTLRLGPVQLKLCAHPLKTRGESLDLLLLLSQSQLEALSLFSHRDLKISDGRLLFLDLALLLLHFLVFLEKLVEQHGIDLLVTNGLRMPSFVTQHQSGVHCSYVFSD